MTSVSSGTCGAFFLPEGDDDSLSTATALAPATTSAHKLKLHKHQGFISRQHHFKPTLMNPRGGQQAHRVHEGVPDGTTYEAKEGARGGAAARKTNCQGLGSSRELTAGSVK